MVEIKAEDIREAFRRFEDFQRVQTGAEDMSESELREALEALVTGQDPGVSSDAIARLALSVGITDEARREFYAKADERTRIAIVPTEQLVDFAAFMGLVVGLTARQVAEERAAE
jgi:hypothetical protein